MAHLVLIYFAAVIALGIIALIHYGKKILHHLVIGWVVGLGGAEVFSNNLTRTTGVVAASGKTIVLNKLGSASGPVAAVSTPVVGGAVVGGLLILLVLASAFISWTSKNKEREQAAESRTESPMMAEGGER
jgi:preprotein translocase subunit SecG